MKLFLHRGIAVESAKAKEIIINIRESGISGDEGSSQFQIPNIMDLRKKLDTLYSMNNLSRDDIFRQTPNIGICVCGDELGAKYFAQKHNITATKSESILISFKADINNVYVDCRDFLCTIFQNWDLFNNVSIDRQLLILKSLYGEAIIRYFDRCMATSNQQTRIAMCNLASFDINVVKDHFRNKTVIGGRHGTRFCSAFFVKTPISPSSIKYCDVLDGQVELSEPEINIYDFNI